MAKKNKKKDLDFNNIDLYIIENYENRPLSFFIYGKKILSNISIFFLILSLVMIVSGKLIIESRNKNKTDYVTNVFGNNIEYVQTERRQKIINDFLKNYENN